MRSVESDAEHRVAHSRRFRPSSAFNGINMIKNGSFPIEIMALITELAVAITAGVTAGLVVLGVERKLNDNRK